MGRGGGTLFQPSRLEDKTKEGSGERGGKRGKKGKMERVFPPPPRVSRNVHRISAIRVRNAHTLAVTEPIQIEEGLLSLLLGTPLLLLPPPTSSVGVGAGGGGGAGVDMSDKVGGGGCRGAVGVTIVRNDVLPAALLENSAVAPPPPSVVKVVEVVMIPTTLVVVAVVEEEKVTCPLLVVVVGSPGPGPGICTVGLPLPLLLVGPVSVSVSVVGPLLELIPGCGVNQVVVVSSVVGQPEESLPRRPSWHLFGLSKVVGAVSGGVAVVAAVVVMVVPLMAF